MRVEQQQNQSIVDIIQQASQAEEKGAVGLFGDAVKTKKDEKTESQSFFVKDATYLNPTKEDKKTITEEIEEGTAMDAEARKEQMAVLSNTTSGEDYAKMQEDGFSMDSTATNTIVTVTDKIKAELARAGVDISCFGDELDMSEIEAIAGSPELATQLANAMREADLPVTGDNVKEAAEVTQMTAALSEPSEGAVKYLVDNQLAPTVENVYKAEHSGSSNYQTAATVDTSSFEAQIQSVIEAAGLEVNEDTMKTSQWMLENDIPLTAENISYVQALKEMELPQDTTEVIDLMVQAMCEGNRPKDAMLLPEYSLTEQAKDAMNVVQEATDADLQYVVENDMELTIDNLKAAHNATANSTASDTQYTQQELNLLTARRQLEELRLAMTAEANYALLKRGISIDTEPIEQLVAQLKEQENSYYQNLLASQNIDATEENVSLFKEVTERVTEIQSVPAYVLGIKNADVSSINGVYAAGSALKTSFEEASMQYETLKTAPRADLGDSIQKAFGNVDDILKSIDMEPSEENRRAVRILGYNELPITQESVAQMKAADEEVQRTFQNMTPAVVTQMIKRGVNPLDMEFSKLNQVAEEIKSSELASDDNQKFSEYLWKLEQNHDISEEERSAYIGIYRLIRQVENTDGAAIGSLINQGSTLTMKNLLTAVRTEKRNGKMDYAVDDDFGGANSAATENASITDQIEAGYQKNCAKDVLDTITPETLRTVLAQNLDWENMTPEQLKEALAQAKTQTDETGTEAAYAKEQLANFEQAANAPKDIYEALEKYDIPNTMNNVLAMETLMKNRNQMYRKIFGSSMKAQSDETDATDTDELEETKQGLLAEFSEALSGPASMEEAQEKLGDLAEKVTAATMDSDTVTSLDVREMKLLSAQLSISGMMAKEERYSVPVAVNDEIMNVSVTIVRGEEKQGVVDITMESDTYGKIAATFQAKENGISGLIATDSKSAQELLENNTKLLKENLSTDEEESFDIHCAYIGDLDLNHFSNNTETETKADGTVDADTYQVQTTRLYHMAESFIRTIKEGL